MGHAKVFLSRKFGPRVRLGSIITDAELEPDPIIKPGTICTKCGRCVKECPGNAVPPVGEKDKLITVKIGGVDISWADVDMGRCVLTHHGLNNTISPFLKKDLPNVELDVSKTEMTEEEAYRLAYPVAGANWTESLYDEHGSAVVKYYKYVMDHTGYFAVCGARGCIRACMDSLEKNGRIESRFENPFYKKPSWILPCEKGEKRGAVNPFREKWLEEEHPDIMEREKT
jgi:ferredoxin